MSNKISTLRDRKVHKVQSIRHISETAFVIRMDRNGLEFESGQYINIGLSEDLYTREYSIYSGANEDFIEVLIKEVKDGLVSKRLKKVKAGDVLMIDGPFGFFTLKEKDIKKKKFLFIASGTGISPIHSFVKMYPEMDYTLIHGVRNASEAYDRNDYKQDAFVLCTSRSNDGDFNGRVTDYLKTQQPDKQTLCFLCGNVNMIHDAYDILESKGIPSANLNAEVYF